MANAALHDQPTHQTPVMRAGPKARAGLMHIELTGPSIHIRNGIIRPIARGPILPQPLHQSPNPSFML